MLKYQTDDPAGYETISLGNATTYTDTSVTKGTDTGIWGYELVAENSAGDDIGISAGISFDTVTGEIINDSWHDRMGKLSKSDIAAYLSSKGIEYNASSTKSELLKLV